MAAQRSGIAVAVLRAGVEDIASQGHGVGDDAADPAHPAFERPELLAWQGAEGGCLGRNELPRKGESDTPPASVWRSGQPASGAAATSVRWLISAAVAA